MALQSNLSHSDEKPNIMERMGGALAEWSEKWFPDAYVFACFAVVIVTIAALAMGRSPMQIGVDFGANYWSLVPFTMQMAFVIISGYVVAMSAPVHRLIEKLAEVPKTAKGAVAFVAFFAMVASLLSWGFSLIFSGVLIKEVSKRVKDVDYRAMGAAGYLGLGSIWALGLSSSAALQMATKSSIPAALYKISGVIPLSQTIFTWQSGVMVIVLITLSVTICYFSAPDGKHSKTADSAGIQYGDNGIIVGKPTRPGEKPEYSPVLTIIIVVLGALYLIDVISKKGPIAALDLNTYNLLFLLLGMILHKSPRAFLNACAKAVPATGSVLIQFPIYAGIFGILMGSGLNEVLMNFFVSVSNGHTFAPIVGVYSAILGFLLPSGGAKWVVEAPYILSAAQQLHFNMGWVVQIYNAAEALPNFINPFWMLPLMGVMGVKARDLAGFSFLQLIFHAPVVLIMVWLLGYTMQYVPPIMM
ncbi:short-chain fatty acid transporter [Desulfitobacterium sp.]|uniref:short-chain fatty acid transporter n=1 Tax=Desulfitobacterium sp. TaxID=49981 RepID=UPI002CBE2AB3|nr:TIGR00366 family protein [Desulfitobacterium sp.]HVJ48334.1 TIGR00366 family protein [Desulfitobacterium sp.]